jgi:hypothetical protein
MSLHCGTINIVVVVVVINVVIVRVVVVIIVIVVVIPIIVVDERKVLGNGNARKIQVETRSFVHFYVSN